MCKSLLIIVNRPKKFYSWISNHIQILNYSNNNNYYYYELTMFVFHGRRLPKSGIHKDLRYHYIILIVTTNDL